MKLSFDSSSSSSFFHAPPLETARSALQFVDASDRETWLRMGMAIKSEMGDSGFDLWETWSQQADSYNAKDARDVWKSIRAGGKVTIGTLFYEAKANGWRDEGKRRKPTREELAERQRKAAERAKKEEAEIALERASAAAKAAAILQAATEAKPDHPYLVRKQVSPVATLQEIDAGAAAAILGYTPKSGGEPLAGRLLVVPVRQDERISTLELIDGDGRKAALAGRGSKTGGYWATERLPDGNGAGLTLLIGEGVATVLSAAEASGRPAIAALSAGNLLTVAKAMRERYPAAALVILADLVKTSGKPDQHAIQAAQAVSGVLAAPDFGSDRDPDKKDFNDLAALRGLEAVKAAIEATASTPAIGKVGQEQQPTQEQQPPTRYAPLLYIERGKKKLVSQQEAAAFLAEQGFKNRLRFDPVRQDWYHYQPQTGAFIRRPALVSESAVYRAIRKYSGNFSFGASYVSGVARCLVWESVGEVAQKPGVVGFKNGVLDLQTHQLHPHSPDFGLLAVLPFDWEPTAEAPAAFIDWLMEATDHHADQVELLRAWIQACIVGRADLQRFLEIIGHGGSGKGTLIRILCDLLGKEAIHSTTLKQMEENRFETAKIYGKKLVVITDADRHRGDVSMLKSITGEDPIRFEEKHRQAGDCFTYGGMVLIAGNQHTESSDYSSGIQRRRITVRFDHVVPAEQQRDLIGEFTPLLSAIAAWALAMPHEEVTRLLRSTDVSVPSLRGARLETLAATNPIAAWLMDCCVADPGAAVQIGVKQKLVINTGRGDGDSQTESRTVYENADNWLYPNYCKWCDEHGKQPVAHNFFSNALMDVVKNMLKWDGVEKTRSMHGTFLKGLRLKTYDEPMLNYDEPMLAYPIDYDEHVELSKNKVVLESESDIATSSTSAPATPTENFEEHAAKGGESALVQHVHHNQSLKPSWVHHKSVIVQHRGQHSSSTVALSPDARALWDVLRLYRGWAAPDELARKSGLGSVERTLTAAQELVNAGLALMEKGMVKPILEARP